MNMFNLNVTVNTKINGLNRNYEIVQASSAHHVLIIVTITRSEECALLSGSLT